MESHERGANSRITCNSAMLAQLSTMPTEDVAALYAILASLLYTVVDKGMDLPAGVRRVEGPEELLDVRATSDLRALVKPDRERHTIEILAAARDAQIEYFARAFKKSA